jgi:hypothetical protein
VKAFPNPTSGSIFLEFPANWFETLQVLDIAGRVLHNEKINRGATSQTLNNKFATGTYFIRLNGRGKVAVKKMVVL